MSPPPRLGSVPPQLPKNQTLPEHGAGRNRCSPQPECGAIRAFAAPNVHEGFRGEDETASLSEPRVEPSEGRRERAVTSGGRGALQYGRSRQFSRQDRSLWPEFLRIPAPRSRLRRCAGASVTQTKRRRFQSREWSRPKDGENERSHPGAGGASRRPFAAVFAARPRTLAGILANSGAPFAAPNAHEGFRDASETASLSEPRVEPSEGRREPAVAAAGARSVSTRPFTAVFAARPLTLAGILANSGAPFAAPKVRGRFRDANETASLSEPRVKRPKAARTSGHTPGRKRFNAAVRGGLRSKTAHSGRNSREFRRPVRDSEGA